MVSRNIRGQEHDSIVFLNDMAVLPPAMVSGVNIWTVSGSKFVGQVIANSGSSTTGANIDSPLFSGTAGFLGAVQFSGTAAFAGTTTFSGTVNLNGALTTTKTNTAATSGPYAPLGYISINISGNTVKVPFFTV